MSVLEYTLIGLAVLVAIEGLVIVHLSRSVRKVSKVADRVANLGAALALLTDTTEAGLASVAVELERVGTLKRPATTATRRATSKRITTAARNGRTLEEIAASEALSESEVRLHLQLANQGGFGAPLRG
jgi:hypothetical protein